MTTLLLLCLSVSVRADWNPGDAYKMHFPQQPDPVGFDVKFDAPSSVADDWKCSETGPVTDVHFWFSARADWLNLQNPLDHQIVNIHVAIHSDVPGDAANPSHPGQILWQRDFSVQEVKIRQYGVGPQSWFDPATGLVIPNDHNNIYQCNITNILRPFYQKKGTIYWLDVSMTAQGELGWKSSDQSLYPQPYTGNHYQDDATWAPASTGQWQDLHYPAGPQLGQSMDMAFVVTGIPQVFNYKMHFPQWPDPTGADIPFTYPRVAADDWRCSETGPVDDVHFWFSAFNDWLVPTIPLQQQIQGIHLSIHADIPDPDGPGPLFSMPGALLWQRDFPADALNIQFVSYITEGQAWYDPAQGYQPANHYGLYRCDVDSIPQPFIQTAGNIYWLDISVYSDQQLGWKTADLAQYPQPYTGNHFQDDGVWGVFPAAGGDPTWTDLTWPPGLPNGGQSIDLSFIVTKLPHPTPVGGSVPKSFQLDQNYPNPFNPSTTIRYALPAQTTVQLAIFGVDGGLIRVLDSGVRSVGTHEATWDGRDSSGNPVASGVYFYRLTAGSFTQTKKMVLMK